ncbi:MAG: DUF4956 domain-containing protein [Cyclobacteriaceae bacterium]|nr:DUF4956 domain-containing protein [Cyclobacteriaceae bacterium]
MNQEPTLFTPDFLWRIGVDLLSLIILVRFVYHTIYKKKDFFFTFFMFNLIIFVITYMLHKVKFSVGAAFGLFAIFSLLRYRTENISPKDMTYLFIVIAIGLISAIGKGVYWELAAFNGFIIAFIYTLDGNLVIKNELTQTIQYRGLEKLKPENHQALIQELSEKTGLEIHKVSIESINLPKESAVIKVYYYERR